MEQQSNTVQNSMQDSMQDSTHLSNIIHQLFNRTFDNRYNLSFEQFLELIDNETENSVCWKYYKFEENNDNMNDDNDSNSRKIYLFSNEWNKINFK